MSVREEFKKSLMKERKEKLVDLLLDQRVTILRQKEMLDRAMAVADGAIASIDNRIADKGKLH